MTRVLFTGSFDPVTQGHADIIARLSRIFPEVVVTVFQNAEKAHLFTPEERLAMLSAVAAAYPNVMVDVSSGYVADYVKAHKIDLIVRGIRNPDDVAYEREMAEYNKAHSGVETMYFFPEREYASLSSTAAREYLMRGEIPVSLVPDEIIPFLFGYFEKKGIDKSRIK